MTNICPVCKQPSLPITNPGAEFLVIGGYPKPEELSEGSLIDYQEPFRQELFRIKVDPRRFQFYNILHHKKGARKTKLDREIYEKCQSHALTLIMNMLDNKKGLFLFGSEAFNILTGLKVTQYSSLPVQSAYVSQDVRVVGSIKPAQTLGEFRLALQRFMKPFMEE